MDKEMEVKIRKTLACIDFSEYTSLVLSYTAEIAQHSTIVVYNVINQRDVDMLGVVNRHVKPNVSAADFVLRMKQERMEKMNSLITKYFSNHDTEIIPIIDVGIPSLQILKTIEVEAIDLVVLANKGKENIPMVLFGSAAEKVYRHSPVPVVSVRNRKSFRRKK